MGGYSCITEPPLRGLERKLRYCGLQNFSGADDFANPYSETEEHENDWVLHSGPQHNVLHELKY